MIDNIENEFNKLNETDDWKMAFMDIKRPEDYLSFSPTVNNAKNAMNLRYNRYKDILPYDHSRVKLKEIDETDYINANYVECKRANRKYILAQAPLRNTCEHFWQMIWEQNSRGIVMLNRLFEKGIPKCEMYYPNVDEENSDTLEFGKFRLNFVSEKTSQDYSIRTIECENMQQKEKRTVYHCHFSSWPDFGEPTQTNTFLDFLNECSNKFDIFNNELYGPAVVHCSAGVGRSGTFILIDSAIQLLVDKQANEPSVNVSDLLGEFRTYRMGLIQTHQQFKFAYQAIIDFIKQEDNDTKEPFKSNYNDVLVNDSFSTTDEDEDENDEDDDDDDGDDDSPPSSSSSDENHNSTNETRKNKSARPGTSRYKHSKNQIKLSKEAKNNVKKLRQIQLENSKLKRDDLEQIDLDVKTAVNKTKNRNSDLSDENDNEENLLFYTNRNVSTVKVNTQRKSLARTDADHENVVSIVNDIMNDIKKSNENEIGELRLRNTNDFSQLNDTNNSKNKHLTEREHRLAEKVNSMRQKQIEHEQSIKISNNDYLFINPLLIGGGIFLGGLLLHQIYKIYFK